MCSESVLWSDPHNSSLIMIACMNIIIIITIGSKMIVKAKRHILLYKDFVVSHSASLEDKQRI